MDIKNLKAELQQLEASEQQAAIAFDRASRAFANKWKEVVSFSDDDLAQQNAESKALAEQNAALSALRQRIDELSAEIVRQDKATWERAAVARGG